MDLRRRTSSKSHQPSLSPSPPKFSGDGAGQVQASDALPLPIRHTNKLFSVLFMVSIYFLMSRWRMKIRMTTPLHVLTLSELSAIVGLIASLIYLISFFGIAYVQSFISTHEEDEDFLLPAAPTPPAPCPLLISEKSPVSSSPLPSDDEEIISAVVSGKIPSYILETRLGDCLRAVRIRREAIRRITGRGMEGLPLDGFNYDSILGQCCEMPVGYVQLPVGIAGPLRLDGKEHFVPMATTEGCLVASTNRGCKAISESGGAASVVLRDGMTRAPVVRFATAKRAAEFKFFLEDPLNFETLAIVFNRSSRFAKLQSIKCSLAGKNLYIRFSCRTGDAMGMNMVSKGVQNVLDYLQNDFPDLDLISISGTGFGQEDWTC